MNWKAEALPTVALFVVLCIVATLGTEYASLLEYRRSLLWGEPWRLLTAHLVHVDGQHLLGNLVALCALQAFLPTLQGFRRSLLLVTTCSLAVSLCLYLFSPEVDWFRGLSGVLHGLIVVGCFVHWRRYPVMCTAAFVLLGFKLVVEPMLPSTFNFSVVHDAHRYGAVAGLMFAIAILARYSCCVKDASGSAASTDYSNHD